MQDSQTPTIEQALNKSEQDADNALKVADKVLKGLKQFKQAAERGDTRKLRAAADAVQLSIATLDQEISNLKDSWEFDEESYLRSGAFAKEFLAKAKEQGLPISEQDGRFFSYPVVIKIEPGKRAVVLDKATERNIRPSVLVELLQAKRDQPSRFKSANFLESLYRAYLVAIASNKDLRQGAVIPLRDIYQLLTLMPDKDYSIQEFTRDVSLLDSERVTTTKNGRVMSFDAATGTKSRGVLSIVMKDGSEQQYYGISFYNPSGD